VAVAEEEEGGGGEAQSGAGAWDRPSAVPSRSPTGPGREGAALVGAGGDAS